MEMIRKILAFNLARLRDGRDLKQQQVAEACEFETPTYNRWENGHAWPKPSNLETLANFYGVPSSEFFKPIEEAMTKPTIKEALQVIREEMGLSIEVAPGFKIIKK